MTVNIVNTLSHPCVEVINDASHKSAALSALEMIGAQLNLTDNAPSYEADDGEMSNEYRGEMMVFVEHHSPVKYKLRLVGSLLHDL